MEHHTEERPATWRSLPSWLLSQAAHHSHRLVADGLAVAGANGYHYRILATLDEFGPASQAALGRRSSIHVSDIVAMLNELTERELVERAPDPSDRRRNIISLTTAGKRHLRRLERQLAEAQDELLAPLSPEERRHLTELLSKLSDQRNQRAGAPESPSR